MIYNNKRIPSKNTTLFPPPLTTKSPRRSSPSRVNNPSRSSTQTRRLRHTPRITTRTTHQPITSTLHLKTRTARGLHLRTNLPPPNRPKGANRLQLRHTHRTCRSRYSLQHRLRLRGCTTNNNSTWPNLIRSICTM